MKRGHFGILSAKGITVDVLVANVARFTEPKPIFELGSDEVWSQLEVNVKSHLYFTEQFYSQPSGNKKVRKDLFVLHSDSESKISWTLGRNANELTLVPRQRVFSGNPHDSPSWGCPTPSLYAIKDGCNASFPSYRSEHTCPKITSY